MRKLLKWALPAALCIISSCAKVEDDSESSYFDNNGVYGYISPAVNEDEPDTKATVRADDLWLSFAVGDRINIWSNSGTTLLYKVVAVNDNGRAKFEGGGFDLTDGETYYSSFPLIRSTADDFNSVTVTYEGQVQQADNDANHLANYAYSYATATCNNHSASFTYTSLCGYFKFFLAVPEVLTFTELTITAADAIFALNGTQDVSAGANGFTAGEMSDVMTLKLNNIEVSDGELDAFLALAACNASEYVIRLKATNGKVYTSPKISKTALKPNGIKTFRTEVFEGENPPVAKIGSTVYMTLAEAVAAVPADGTETTITMIGDDMINVVGSAITVPATKNIILDLNGHNVVGTAEQGSTSALITNKGTLTIKDSSDANADGTGKGKLISGATTTWVHDGGDDYSGSYASNTVTNTGTLTIESGYVENLSTGSATYAVDNNSSGADAILNVNGGLLKARSVAVRQFANNVTKENTVNVAGGTIQAGYSGIWIQLPGSDATKAMKAKLNVTGGTLTGGSYAFYDYTFGNNFNATQYTLAGGTFNGYIFSYGANIEITDGTFTGDVAIKQAKPSTVSVSGGKFAGDVYTYGASASTGFISGGVFATTTYEDEGNTYDCDWLSLIADGYMAAANTDEATMAAYPYTVAVDPTEYVAKINGKKYETLEAAFAAAKDGDTITLLADCAGNGIVAPQGKFGTTGLTVDFAGHTYTMDGTMVGSTGTETQAFQLLMDNKITFKNGTITSEKAKILVQNYSDLTLEGMTLTLNNPIYAYAYTLSNNNGNILIDGSTINANPAGGFAFDVCRYAGYPSVNVTVTGESVINGNVEVFASANDAKDGFSLMLETALNGEIVLDNSAKAAMAATPDKAIVSKKTTVEQDAPADYKWEAYGTETEKLVPCDYVAQVGDVKYETLEAAFAAAQDGQTITLLANCAGNGIVAPQGKFGTTGLTVDFNNHTYTVVGNLVGSTGTETQAFQLLKDNKITFKNGTVYSEKALFLVQNYSDLTLEGMTLTLNNANYAYGYTLSNNNGNVVIDGTTINANPAGAFAFDVCRNATYPSVNVTVKGESVINGDIEVSASGNDAKDGFFLTVNGGTFNGNLVIDGSAATAMANTPDKAVIKKDNDVTLAAPANFKWEDNNDGTSTLKAKDYVAQIGDVMYESLADAIAAVQNGETILMTADVDNAAGMSVASGKSFTVDFQNHTYTLNKPGAGSAGTETSGFQFLMGSTITLKNGTIDISEENLTPATAPAKNIMRIIQNYANLTLDNMTIDGTNQYGGKDYVVSYNNGSSVIKDTKVIAGTDNIAFDVCRYSSYPSVNVTVTGSSEITGKIEVSASGSDAKDGFGLTVESGTISGNLVIDGTAATAMANTPNKAVITKDNDVTLAAPANFKWEDNGDGTSTLKAITYVAKIGDNMFETLEEAFAAAQDGQTIEVLKAGEYTLPNMPNNVTVEGAVEGVVFNHTTAGNVASIPNGATFKNVTFNFGNVNYHGFQHPGTINMEGCTLNGKFFSYGEMNFTNCKFNQSNSDYHMWAYAGNLTYTGCTFTNTTTGKFLNVYNETGTKYTVTATNCKFTNLAASANKAALNVKATCGAKLLAYDVIINNCTTEGAFPAASTSSSLVVLNALVQVDDRTADGVDNITVTQDGVKVYPAEPVHIGSNSYATIQAAFDAAQDGDVITVDAGTYNEVVNVTGGKTVTIQAAAGADVTLAGINHSSNGTPSTITVKNITVDNALQTEGWFTGTSPKINPCVGAWGGHFAFDGCTFKVSGAGKYETGIMTWWTVAKTTFDFDNCVFEASDAAGSKPSSARAMQIYGDVDMTVDGCTFATAKSYSLKYVGEEGCTAVFNDNTVSNSTCFVQLGSSVYAGTGYSISLNNTTYSGEIAPYLIDNEESQTVYIDGVKVYPAVPDYETDANGNLSIYTAAGMQYFASQVNDSQVSYSGKTVTLMNDIDMTGIDWIPVGQTGGYGAKTYFQGTFDGNGKTISNLTVTHWEEGTNGGAFYASGLFGFIDAAGATVKNLTVDHANVTGSHWTGAIVGYLSGEISGCTVTNSSVVCTNKNSEANGDKAGLITGYINGTQGTVTNCTGSNSTVQAYRDAGQLVGAAKSTQVSGCTATNVTVTGTGGGNIRNEVIGRLL